MKPKSILSFVFLLMLSKCLWAQNKSFTTHLPIIYLNTSGYTIPDDPKINAKMEIAWKGEGTNNSTSDPHDHFSGTIAIEVRGSSSQMFPKKSYGFELKTETGEDMDFPLLGLPEEEDWILYAPYSDKSLIRNVLTFTLANQMGTTYATRCRMVELFLNDEYEGVYVLMEKIKRGPDRVDIAKLKPEDISGEDLTGGYIVKIDKTTGSGGDGWSSQYLNTPSSRTFYQYDYPKSDEIRPEQKNYIRSYVDEFETAVNNLWHDDQKGYQNYMELPTFYDYAIINELSRNVDGYRLSSYLNKDKNGKLNAGPVWDYNLAYGNADYYYGWYTTGLFVFQNNGDDYWQVPFWWKKLMADATFVNPLRCRWEELRENVLDENHINGIIDSLTTYLGSAVDRNFARWPILTEYVWPNYYVGNTYPNEITWMKNWLSGRLGRLDLEMPGVCGEDPNNPEPGDGTFALYPNPFKSELTLRFDTRSSVQCQFQLFNLNGRLIKEIGLPVTIGENDFNLTLPSLVSGMYLYRIIQSGSEIASGKLVKL